MAIGLVISILAIGTAPSFSIHPDNCEQSQNKQSDNESNDETILSTNALATPLSFEINIDPQLFLVATIPAIEELDLPEILVTAKNLFSNKELKIILRRIISPNAP